MAEVKWDIKKNLGVIAEGSWSKEVNIVSWNDKAAKVDIRSWDKEHKKMSKGITLGKEELKKLKDIINGLDIDSLEI